MRGACLSTAPEGETAMRVLLLTAVLVGLLPVSAALADAPPPPPRPPQTFCTEVYQPVCGYVGGKRITYSNRCFAGIAGAADITDGPCGPADGGPVKPQ